MDRGEGRVRGFGGVVRRRLAVVCIGVLSLLGAENGSGSTVQAGDRGAAFLAPILPQVQSLISAHEGFVGFIVLDPESGESFAVNADALFPVTASISVPIMVDLFYRIEEGQMAREDPLTMLAIDRVDGPGVLGHLSVPRTMTTGDAVYLAVTLSDLTATNLLIKRLRPRIVTERMRQLGLPGTRLLIPPNGEPTDSYDPVAAAEFGMGQTTPREFAELFAMLYRKEVASPEASDEMIEILRHEFYLRGIRSGVPGDVVVAHKTGTTENGRSDCGIVFGPNRDLVICAMTQFDEDLSRTVENRGFELISNLTRLAFTEANFGSTARAAQSRTGRGWLTSWFVWAGVLGVLAIGVALGVRRSGSESAPESTEGKEDSERTRKQARRKKRGGTR